MLHWLHIDLFNAVRVRLLSIDVVAQLCNDALLVQLFYLSTFMNSELARIIFLGIDYSNCFSEVDCCFVLVS